MKAMHVAYDEHGDIIDIETGSVRFYEDCDGNWRLLAGNKFFVVTGKAMCVSEEHNLAVKRT